jgi:hypothetical protein
VSPGTDTNTPAVHLLQMMTGYWVSQGVYVAAKLGIADHEHKVIRLDNHVKTPSSAEPIPLSQYACEVLQAWKKESPLKSDYVFSEPGCTQ